jgi:hypothetical protein
MKNLRSLTKVSDEGHYSTPKPYVHNLYQSWPAVDDIVDARQIEIEIVGVVILLLLHATMTRQGDDEVVQQDL